jgi:acid stress-induced BolA-like protein IbaG/YrbA
MMVVFCKDRKNPFHFLTEIDVFGDAEKFFVSVFLSTFSEKGKIRKRLGVIKRLKAGRETALCP